MRLFDPNAETFIWIVRWEDFQHYRPDPARGPAWIKAYTAQLDDERYLGLTDRQRALLWDLRMIFAAMRGRVPHGAPTTFRQRSDTLPDDPTAERATTFRRRSDNASTVTRRRQSQTRRDDLDALNHAGFIEFLSRATLEHRLEQLYSPPRAPARPPARSQEGEEEEEKEPKGEGGSPPKNQREEEPPAFATLDPALEIEVARLVAAVTNKDNGSETVLRSFASRLPLGAIVKVRESSAGKPAAYAVSALKDECRERGIGAETRRKTT